MVVVVVVVGEVSFGDALVLMGVEGGRGVVVFSSTFGPSPGK